MSFWNTLGNNAPQIQTLIAISSLLLTSIAVGFAFYSLIYAKKQIKITINQNSESLKLTMYQLSLSILDNAYQCKELISSIKHKNKKQEELFTQLLSLVGKKLDDQMYEYDYTFAEYLREPLKLLDTPQEVIDQIIQSISKADNNLTFDELQLYLKHLIKMQGAIHTTNEGYDRKIEEIKSILPQSTKISS